MGIFNFFKKGINSTSGFTINNLIEKSEWKGSDFEFLIKGDLTISNEDFYTIMIPNSVKTNKIIKDNWVYFEVDGDEFSYSMEPPGIQMTFSKNFTYFKAKLIADEVLINIRETGQEAELIEIYSTNIYKF